LTSPTRFSIECSGRCLRIWNKRSDENLHLLPSLVA
jgi:hypothetical protein